MIDTLEAYLSQDYLRDVDLLAEIPNHLTNLREYNSERAGVAVRGNLSNLRIRVTERGITIEGSIFKGRTFEHLIIRVFVWLLKS